MIHKCLSLIARNWIIDIPKSYERFLCSDSPLLKVVDDEDGDVDDFKKANVYWDLQWIVYCENRFTWTMS